MTQQEIFFDLLQYSIGVTEEIPTSLKNADWQEIYAMGKKRAVLGVLFHGIQRLPKDVVPEQKLLLQWITVAQQIRQANIRLNADCVNVQERFRKAGFRTCILKGQGNALLYPDAYIRTPGDIDILVEGGREKVMKYVNSVCPGQTMRYHHVDFPMMKTAVEVHFTPSYMYNPIANRRLQRWFERNIDLQCSNAVPLPDGAGLISVPTATFNVVYQLSHLYRHVFAEGIGLRQLVDYYYVLKSLPQNNMDTLLNHESNESYEELEKSNKNTRESCSLWLSLRSPTVGSTKVSDDGSVSSASKQAYAAAPDSSSMPLHGICMPLEQKHRFAQKHNLADGIPENATQNIKPNTQNIKLVLAGDTDFEDAYSLGLKEMARKNGVVLTGFIKGRKLHSLLTNCRCYCLPSSHEGLPIALLEAMSYGVKVIVSDIPANLEVGLPKDDYFHCGDVDELATKLGRVIESPLEHVDYDMKKYDWDKIADEVAEVYKSLKR